MPFWAFLHFYEIYNLPDARQKECVNALLGFPSFLHVKISNYAISKISVSMPFWAFLHFYEETLSENRLLRSVSMPFWAFLHFYKLLLKRLYRFRVVCQCPSGLSFISTYKHKWSIVTRPVCVNALSGFPSFLQHPSGTRRNKAFSRPFLQVFI